MTQATQQDADRLKDALRRLQDSPGVITADGRQIVSPETGSVIEKLCSEIGRTLLPRTLVFSNNRREKLCVVAASRRAKAIETQDGSVTILSPQESTSLQSAQRVFRQFCRNATAVFVQSRLETQLDTGQVIGVTPDMLVDEASSSSKPHPTLQEHLKTLRSCSVAYVTTNNDQLADQWGSEELIGRLQLCLAQTVVLDHPCTLWFGNGESGLCFGHLKLGEHTVWVAATKEQSRDLTTFWAECISSCA